MALNMTPVHKNLHTRVTFMGLEFEDMVAVLGVAIVMSLLSHFIDDKARILGLPLNIFLEVVVPLLCVPALMIFKYGRPRGYLVDLVRSLLAPKPWCALERDTQITTPYLREIEEPDEE